MAIIETTDLHKMIETLDTLPKWVRYNAQKYGDSKIAMRHKDFGIWNRYTWKESYEHCKYFGLGLVSLGFERGQRVSIVGDNDPHWYWAEYAAQAVGGSIVGLFVDSIPTEVRYIVEHSESVFVIAKDQEQVDKLLRFVHEIPLIKKIIYWEYKGMWSYDDPILIGWNEVEELGKKYEEEHPGSFEESIDAGKADDYATFLYTSGTTGLPKGAMHNHRTLLKALEYTYALHPFLPEDDYTSCFAPGYVAEQMIGVTMGAVVAPRINFPEEPETMTENIREIGPQFILFTPRMWETTVSTVRAKMLDANIIKRTTYNLLLPIGYKWVEMEMAEEKPNLLWRVLHPVAHLLVFRPVKDKLGLLKNRFSITAGGVLSPDCFHYLRAIGLPMTQIFASSEFVPMSGHGLRMSDFETIGWVSPGCEVKLIEDNEILCRGDGMFLGYYKNPEATEETRGDGWFHTGDAGYLDEEGRLIYWDRVKELVELKSGAKYPPQYIEGKLKFSPFIRDCMSMGGKDRDFVSAIVAVDFEVGGRWAEAHHVPYTTITDLSQKQEIIDLITKDLRRVNRTLPEEQRVRKFVNLHKEFDPDEAELTRTRKLRRAYMEDRYKGIIDAIYCGKDSYTVEAPITYRDGRQGIIKTEIKVNAVEE